LKSYDAFLRFVLARAPRPVTERVPVDQSAGRILLESVRARVDDPAERRSAMDGYAVLARDLEDARPSAPVRLRSVGIAQAARNPRRRLKSGQALRIMTGAPLPEGADTVVPVERIRLSGDQVLFFAPSVRGAYVRKPGENFRKGALLVKRGTLMGPAQIGLCITAGVAEVNAARRLRVGVLATGNELVRAGRALEHGEVYDSNRPMVMAFVAATGAVPVDLGSVRDRPVELARAVRRWRNRLDCLVTIGGVSMGDFDVVKQVLTDVRTVRLYRVAMKPAKPQAFGRIGELVWYGLPGNPVSALVACDRFLRPLLLKGMGHRLLHRPRRIGVLAEGLTKEHPLREFVRAYAWQEEGRWLVRKVGPEGSGNLRSMVNANALVILSERTRRLARGARVPFELLADPAGAVTPGGA
jgi:molybdopterin molybdotransferase